MRLAALLTCLVLLLCLRMHAQQVDTVRVNGTTFVFKKATRKCELFDNLRDTVWKVYRLGDGQLHYLLEHTVRETSADCNNTFVDFGTYRVSGDTLFFHTEMTQKRSDPIPTSRDQAYLVKQDGKLVPLFDHLYDWNGELIGQ